MKASVFILATLAGSLALSSQAGAQSQGQSSGQMSADRVQLPAGGVTLSFTEIDRNNDRSISVEEWNDFVKTLHSRAGRADASSSTAPGTISGGAASGATSSEPAKGGEPPK